MRLRRLELAVIALTLAFMCFMGGYFTGRRGAVNIVTVAANQSEARAADTAALPDKVISNKPDVSGAANATANTGAANSGVSADSGGIAGDNATTEQSAGGEQSAGSGTVIQLPETAGAPMGGDGKININLASQSELMDLPGIGSVLASRIVDHRRQHGSFSRIEDLRNVSGIGEKRYIAIQDQITVG
jgi:competence protein ComEA